MFPVLFRLPIIEVDVPTYGVLLALAFLLILKVAAVLARREGLSVRDVVDLNFTVFLASLIGAKVLLVLLDLPYYLENPGALLGTLRSAGVFYGGLLAAVPTFIWFAHRRGLPLWKVADIAAICGPIGQSIGRLGCYSAGCCYGKFTDVSWAVAFTDPVASETTGVPLHVLLHPVQIYLSVNALMLLGVLAWRYRARRYDGQVFLWFVVLYGATRTFWETYRGDTIRGFLIPDLVSTSQAIGIASVVVGGIAILILRRRNRIEGDPPARR